MNLKLCVVGIAVLGLTGAAQERKQVPAERGMVVGGIAARTSQSVRFMQFEAGTVKGSPYAADALNETIQMLPDGNRIMDKHSSRMYRDAEGRTRTENNFSMLGPLLPEGNAPSITSINDPVSGEHFMLDNNRKSATKMTMPKLATTIKPGEQREVRMEVRHGAPQAVRGALATMDHNVMIAGPAVMEYQRTELRRTEGPGSNIDMKVERLGKQVIEGVECDGTRETVTIPAGQIGNERPLLSVTERWFSEKLKLDVMRKHTDPRFGETNYRLTRIDQADQPRSLFEVPADYKLEEGGGFNTMFDRRTREPKD